jgi:hypothetical protein
MSNYMVFAYRRKLLPLRINSACESSLYVVRAHDSGNALSRNTCNVCEMWIGRYLEGIAIRFCGYLTEGVRALLDESRDKFLTTSVCGLHVVDIVWMKHRLKLRCLLILSPPASWEFTLWPPRFNMADGCGFLCSVVTCFFPRW